MVNEFVRKGKFSRKLTSDFVVRGYLKISEVIYNVTPEFLAANDKN